MNILLTNDDGIDAEGINTLAKLLSKYHNVIMVAPEDQRSASGHSITIYEPIVVKQVRKPYDIEAYSISGTPADCVKVALDKLISNNIDIVISGINKGLNMGNDILYSGTVSAAIEGSMYKIPSIAVSAEFVRGKKQNYEIAAKYTLEILNRVKKEKLKNDVVLNLNIPFCSEEEIKGIKVCKVGNRIFNTRFSEEIDEEGNKILKLEGDINKNINDDTDVYYIRNKYVTLTPLHYDLTNFNILEETETIINEQ
ncbi:5'/3'-nucleotidase SurE [Clostridium sporogenes]|uniref:5'-nucleotidase SurE n=1 Tax=Clostridium botulinum TaxID=1491 RepID=A0A6M0SZ65_CLOBO|nr:5'/3'-nucleotidase SurE [Clostridium sporogenes]NFA59872.1 5'/3'-nucleotidase SurE [Clostridium botulinum]NFI74055.1 5'/3'-nucleotidase SurE [Clostridium sporogenes]NFL71769.1 5'/3'-nucleotidase SurE [Clostridium sporogenes]NFM24625.1 5'/3'-nucleotidase SurE [Clostridium sporogenes]NFP61929.1 5'/3'-nucleotidase SurE [Clostridium sporogenes]